MNAVLFQVKNENTSDSLSIQGINITVKELREKIKEKLSIQSDKEELQLFDEHDRALSLSDKVRQTQKVIVQRLPKQSSRQYCRSCFFQKISTSTPCCRQPICLACDQRFTQTSKCPFTLNTHCQFNYVNYSHQPILPKPEISVQDLQQLINNAAFFVVKSNNETNVHIAKSHNVWATTHRNKKKLQNAFNQFRTVILIFTANRCERFLGCAKMVNIYVNAPYVKWQGTGNVVLDDNFGIEWLRRGTLDFSKVGERVNQITGEPISKSRDCQEIFSDLGKQLCMEFEIKSDDNQYINIQEPIQQEQPIIQQQNYTQQQIQVENSPKSKPIEQSAPPQQFISNHDEDEVQWDYDAILQQNNPNKVEKQQSSQNKDVLFNQSSISVIPPVQQILQTNESKHDSDSESDSESSEANPPPDNNANAQQLQLQMMMLQNPAYLSLILQQQQQQQYKHQVDTWNTLNRGKIPGLTGKIKYQHPYFQQMAQQQALQQHQAIEMMKQMNQKDQQKEQGYDRSRSEESKRRHRKEKRSSIKSKRSKSISKDRRSKRKSNDKDKKQKSHKDKSRSRSYDRHKKHRKH